LRQIVKLLQTKKNVIPQVPRYLVVLLHFTAWNLHGKSQVSGREDQREAKTYTVFEGIAVMVEPFWGPQTSYLKYVQAIL
jgi:hypothetical protein